MGLTDHVMRHKKRYVLLFLLSQRSVRERMKAQGLWVLFRGSFFRAMKTELQESDPRAVLVRARITYRNILSDVKLPHSRFDVNIMSCAMLSAFLKSFEKKYDVDTIRKFYATGMNTPIMRMMAKNDKVYTPEGRVKLKEQAEKSQQSKNPYDWKFTVEDGPTISQYSAIFTTCGICHLMGELGLSEYVPAMCSFDYDMAKMGETAFTREFTLASGGPYCDCHYDHRKKRVFKSEY